jgi:hypothetical protein
MEEKRGIKPSRSSVSNPSSSSSSGASTPPLSLSDSVPPPEASSHRPPSLVGEHDSPSEAILVVDLSFDEEEIFHEITREAEFARRLFGKLNRELLGPLGDGNVIILSDSDEEKEVHEEITAADEAAPPYVGNSPTPSVCAADADDVPDRVQDDNSDDEDKTSSP